LKLKICSTQLRELTNKAMESSLERVFIGTGHLTEKELIVEEIDECPNISENPETLFKADPLCIYTVYKKAESLNKTIVLLVHTHPESPEPSLLDIRNMKTWLIPWLIISSLTGESKVWMCRDGKPIEIPIELNNC
jgi:proteasome lid subunit RPN8/RPN11